MGYTLEIFIAKTMVKFYYSLPKHDVPGLYDYKGEIRKLGDTIRLRKDNKPFIIDREIDVNFKEICSKLNLNDLEAVEEGCTAAGKDLAEAVVRQNPGKWKAFAAQIITSPISKQSKLIYGVAV